MGQSGSFNRCIGQHVGINPIGEPVLPIIGNLAVADVKKSHITQVTDELLARGVKCMGKMIFALMRQMFNFAVERDVIPVNPTATINKAKVFGTDNERDRILSDDELKELASKMQNANLMQIVV